MMEGRMMNTMAMVLWRHLANSQCKRECFIKTMPDICLKITTVATEMCGYYNKTLLSAPCGPNLCKAPLSSDRKGRYRNALLLLDVFVHYDSILNKTGSLSYVILPDQIGLFRLQLWWTSQRNRHHFNPRGRKHQRHLITSC